MNLQKQRGCFLIIFAEDDENIAPGLLFGHPCPLRRISARRATSQRRLVYPVNNGDEK
jgi:hypothetical protein